MHEGLLIFQDLNTVQRSVAKFSVDIKKKGGNVFSFIIKLQERQAL